MTRKLRETRESDVIIGRPCIFEVERFPKKGGRINLTGLEEYVCHVTRPNGQLGHVSTIVHSASGSMNRSYGCLEVDGKKYLLPNGESLAITRGRR